MIYSDLIDTIIGKVIINWSHKTKLQIKSINILADNLPDSYPFPIKRNYYLRKILKSVLSSKTTLSFNYQLFDTEKLSLFTNKILKTLLKTVKKGGTISYSNLAVLSGYPKAARALGTVMAKNRFPLFIPCHRVIKNDGNIGNFLKGNPSGREIKMKLLALEQKRL